MNDPGHRSCNRLFEWIMTIAMSGLGVQLLLWPGSLIHSRFASFAYLVPPAVLTFLCITIGFSRGVVLYLNGNLAKYGPPARAIAALASASIWCQLAAALIGTGTVPSPTIPVYLSLVIGELISIWRAARDSHGLNRSF